MLGDGAAGDGRWGATPGAKADGLIVQFYIEAADIGARIRRFSLPLPGGAALERRLRGGDRLPAAGPGP